MIVVMMSLAGLLTVSGCDSVTPGHRSTMVVEAWFDTASPLPPIRISTTRAVSEALTPEAAPADTRVEISMGNHTVAYTRSPDDPLSFIPLDAEGLLAAEGDRFDVRIDAPGSSVRASGTLPPPIHLRDVRVSAPEKPISVVLIDSLDVGLDSLNLAVNATTGFMYPVQVSLTWENDAFDGWIETRLQPDNAFSSSLIDFFLLPSQVFPESSARVVDEESLSWEGVYAIPVTDADSPLPPHSLRVVITRGDDRFARFITSRDAPDRREPDSNVNGGLGYVGGISTDSTRVDVIR